MSDDDSTTTTSTSTGRQAVLRNADDWIAWDVQIEGRLYLMKLYDKLTTGATGDEKKAIYGLIATTVAGEAATTLRASGAKGDGPAAYKALKDEYSGGRTMQAGNDFRRALSEGQGSSSTQKYLLTKRSLFAAIEQVFEKDYEKLWNFAKASSTILNGAARRNAPQVI